MHSFELTVLGEAKSMILKFNISRSFHTIVSYFPRSFSESVKKCHHVNYKKYRNVGDIKAPKFKINIIICLFKTNY